MTRVVLASELEWTKLVGGPFRDVNTGGAGEFAVVGAVFGTRCTDEHAATLSAVMARRSRQFRRSGSSLEEFIEQGE